MATKKPPKAGTPLAELSSSWGLSLAAAQKSNRTITSYIGTVMAFSKWLETSGMPADAERTDAPEIQAFLLAEAERTSKVSAAVHYRNLRVFWGWVEGEGERTGPNPMRRVAPVKVTTKVKSALTTAQLAGLLKACEGNSFEDRRDTAIVRLLVDTGCRVGGIASMRLDGLSIPRRTATAILKGGDELVLPLGARTASAMDRYVRARRRHPSSGSEWLWLGLKGHDTAHLGVSGIQAMLVRRGETAGIEKLRPHAFRRTFARTWLDGGGSEFDLMQITGWKTRAMIDIYAGDLAAERARDAHARLSPGDKL